MCVSCAGAIFEPSKRRRMPFILSLRFINLIIELVFTCVLIMSPGFEYLTWLPSGICVKYLLMPVSLDEPIAQPS